MTGFDKNRDRVLRQIMALSFAQNDLVLFLDTHPDNQKALREYHRITPQLAELRQYYKENFGPLTPSEVTSTTDWTWVNRPWPWEN
ncbi:MAG: spore coat protein CotJB [Clostridia bacterium]